MKYCIRKNRHCDMINCTCIDCISGQENPDDCVACDFCETCIYVEVKDKEL